MTLFFNHFPVCHFCLVLFSSFRPQGGVVKSATIYPSDFGLERMAAEDVEGPAELIEEREGEEEETVEVRMYSTLCLNC